MILVDGYLLMLWSYVFDVDEVIVVFYDGICYLVCFVGVDLVCEFVFLKIEVEDLLFFDLDMVYCVEVGD